MVAEVDSGAAAFMVQAGLAAADLAVAVDLVAVAT